VLFRLVAGPGVHWLKYRGAWMQVRFFFLSTGSVKKKKHEKIGEARARDARDAVGVWYAVGDGHAHHALARPCAVPVAGFAEARDAALRGQEGRLVVRTAWGTEWRPFGLPRRKRPLHSVVLAPGVAEKIVEDVSAFLGRREWYAEQRWCFNSLNVSLFFKKKRKLVIDVD